MMSAKPMIFLCFLVAGIFGSRFSDQTSIANEGNDVDIESNLSLFYRNNSTAKDETNKMSTIPNGAHLNDLMRGYLQLDLKGVFWGACPNRPGASNFNLLSVRKFIIIIIITVVRFRLLNIARVTYG